MRPGEASPERWLVVEVERPLDDERVGAAVQMLSEIANGGVEDSEGLLRIYLPDFGADAEALVAGVVSALSASTPGPPLRYSHRWQAHEDWSELWRRGLAPRRVTDRLVVTPSWETADTRRGDLVITLDPGMAFGTAEHPTTRGCMRLLDAHVKPGERIADIGAGSGILAIAAVLMGADHVVAVEMDAMSCATAAENVKANAVDDRVEIRQTRVDAVGLRKLGPFGGIVANIESGVLSPLLDGFRDALSPGAWLILSGILQSESEAIVDAAKSAGFQLRAEDREDQWWAGTFRTDRRSTPPESDRGPGGPKAGSR